MKTLVSRSDTVSQQQPEQAQQRDLKPVDPQHSGSRSDRKRVKSLPKLTSFVLALLALGLFLAAIWSISVGAVAISMSDVFSVLARIAGFDIGSADISSTTTTVVRNIRLPRILLAAGVGASLGVCGAALQGVFANPLADPGLIGTSSGAALGAVIGIVSGFSLFGAWSTPLFSFVGALVVTAAVYRVARRDGRTEVVTLVLTGIAVNAIVAAFIGYATFIADDQELRSIVFWQLGSMAAASWPVVLIVFVAFVVGFAVVIRFGTALDLLSLGEAEARHLGVDTERLRRVVLTISALVVGASVAVAGIVSFVGLVVPHLIRLLIGPTHRWLLAASALGGAFLLVLADLFARTVVEPAELPLGVLTSAVGGVFFLWLLLMLRKEQGGWA